MPYAVVIATEMDHDTMAGAHGGYQKLRMILVGINPTISSTDSDLDTCNTNIGAVILSVLLCAMYLLSPPDKVDD